MADLFNCQDTAKEGVKYVFVIWNRKDTSWQHRGKSMWHACSDISRKWIYEEELRLKPVGAIIDIQ